MITKKKSGFTLVELLVVISIISLLSSVVLSALSSARQKSRVARRLSDLHQIQIALENYYTNNGSYPATNWHTQCNYFGAGTAVANNLVIPGLVPTYMPSFPIDPSMDVTNSQNCYFYISYWNGTSFDGTGYKLVDFNLTDMTDTDVSKYASFKDPARNGRDLTICPGSPVDGTRAMAIWTPNDTCQ
ncbi:MAG: prepilin-type N-terminal cleavage/methylation domain-containing protein [bacterium]